MIEITEEIVEKVESYVSARLRAEVRREIVDEVSRKILGEKVWRKESTGERITDPRQSYMMSAQDNIEFSGRLRAALSKAGFRLRTLPGRPPHYFLCPAREAERKADRARANDGIVPHLAAIPSTSTSIFGCERFLTSRNVPAAGPSPAGKYSRYAFRKASQFR